MTPVPELRSTDGLTSAEYLAERVKMAYQNLGRSNLDEVESLYTDDVYFEDPAHGIQGKTALLDYFQTLFVNLDTCSFKFHQTLSDGSNIFMSWTMFLVHPKLSGGETIRVEGASYLKTRNGRIYYHRDYFDMGAMLYEHIPLLGRIVHSIKQRLAR